MIGKHGNIFEKFQRIYNNIYGWFFFIMKHIEFITRFLKTGCNENRLNHDPCLGKLGWAYLINGKRSQRILKMRKVWNFKASYHNRMRCYERVYHDRREFKNWCPHSKVRHSRGPGQEFLNH